MSSVTYLDTVYTCTNEPTLIFYPDNRITQDSFWTIDYRENGNFVDGDTVYTDTLTLDEFYDGSISHQGSDGINLYSKSIEVKPLVIHSGFVGGSCSSALKLESRTNYNGTGDVLFNWEPAENLSNPDIANPDVLIKENVVYTLTVTAPNGCVISDLVNIILQPMDTPDLCMVSIDSSTNKNIVFWKKPALGGIDSVYVYRETNITDHYAKIGAVIWNETNYFIDNNSNPLVQSNKYAISILDSCGFLSGKSTPHKTMHLTINQGMNGAWNLIWEPYLGFEVATYRIYRGSDETNMVLIGTTAGSSTQYSDFDAPAGSVAYQIEVSNPDVCETSPLKSTTPNALTSRSNIALYKQPTLIINRLFYNEFNLYPNPFSDILHIRSLHGNMEGTIEVCSIDGKVLIIKELKSGYSEMDANELKKGLYLLKIKTGKDIFTYSVVKD
jgi:hypothetical protein